MSILSLISPNAHLALPDLWDIEPSIPDEEADFEPSMEDVAWLCQSEDEDEFEAVMLELAMLDRLDEIHRFEDHAEEAALPQYRGLLA